MIQNAVVQTPPTNSQPEHPLSNRTTIRLRSASTAVRHERERVMWHHGRDFKAIVSPNQTKCSPPLQYSCRDTVKHGPLYKQNKEGRDMHLSRHLGSSSFHAFRLTRFVTYEPLCDEALRFWLCLTPACDAQGHHIHFGGLTGNC